MYLSDLPLTVQKCFHPSTNSERDCVKTARDWFDWDAPTKHVTFEKFSPTPKASVEDDDLTASQRLAILSEQFEYSDWELQEILDNLPQQTIINHTSLTLEEHKQGFCEVVFPWQQSVSGADVAGIIRRSRRLPRS